MALNFARLATRLTFVGLPGWFRLWKLTLGLELTYVLGKRSVCGWHVQQVTVALAVPLPWMRPLSPAGMFPPRPLHLTISTSETEDTQGPLPLMLQDYDCW